MSSKWCLEVKRYYMQMKQNLKNITFGDYFDLHRAETG